jgi:hypothetical protein
VPTTAGAVRFCAHTLAATLAVVVCSAPEAGAWGPTTHQRITSEAIDTLPKGLRAFYKAHRLELPSLGLEATGSDDAPERRFQVDRLLPFPFVDLPRAEDAFKVRFPDAPPATGRLPWLVQESYGRLVEAFKSGDKARILAESDTLAALVADLSNPLALTENADGQKTGQHGLWVRFTVRLPEVMDPRLKLSPEAARYLDNPKEYVLTAMNGTYVWLDNLLYEEEIAKRGQSGYAESYYDAFALRAGHLLKARLESAAADVGSFWYTAWTAAGRPELK